MSTIPALVEAAKLPANASADDFGAPAPASQITPPRLKARVLRGGAWAVFGKCWNSLLIVAANALLARVLSLADFAAFLLAFSCVTVLGNLGTLGLNVGIVRYVAESLSLDDVRRARQLALKSWLIALAGSLAIAFVAGFAIWAAEGHTSLLAPLVPLALPLALWIVLHALAVLQGETFRGFHQIGPASVFGTPYNLPFLLGLSWLALDGQASLSIVMWLVLACQGVNLLIGAIYLLSPLVAGGFADSPIPQSKCQPAWIEMLRESLPMAVTTATSLLMAQLDLWIVAAFCSPADLAIYGAVTRLMLLVSTPVNIVNNFVPPLVADLHTRGELRQLETVLRSTATLATLPAIAAFLLVAAASGWLLALFYGEAYRAGAGVLIVLSCGQLINAWCGSAGCALSMTRQQRSAMLAVVFSGALLLAVGPPAARWAGVLGVAVASASATGLQKLLLCWLVWRLLSIRAYGTVRLGSLKLSQQVA
jgi:O-antigen/teichoic acid export membrane protein